MYYGTVSRAYSRWFGAGNVTNATVTSLANQTSYYFAVTAWNTAGLESDCSNEVVYQTPVAGPVDPVIKWANPADIVYGTPLGAGQLNATVGVPGTFTYSPAAGTVLPAGPGQTLSVTFTPTDIASYDTVTAKATLNGNWCLKVIHHRLVPWKWKLTASPSISARVVVWPRRRSLATAESRDPFYGSFGLTVRERFCGDWSLARLKLSCTGQREPTTVSACSILSPQYGLIHVPPPAGGG